MIGLSVASLVGNNGQIYLLDTLYHIIRFSGLFKKKTDWAKSIPLFMEKRET